MNKYLKATYAVAANLIFNGLRFTKGRAEALAVSGAFFDRMTGERNQPRSRLNQEAYAAVTSRPPRESGHAAPTVRKPARPTPSDAHTIPPATPDDDFEETPSHRP